MKIKLIRKLAGAVAAVGAAAGIGPTGCTAPLPQQSWPSVRVAAAGFRFSPGEDYVTTRGPWPVAWPKRLVIASGTAILFEDLDPVPHSFTSDSCASGPGFREPEPPPPANIAADTFDDEVAPSIFGYETRSGRDAGRSCLFDSRGDNPNAFTAQGQTTYVDTTRLAPGTYSFRCVLHDFMQGTLRVVAGARGA